MKHFIQSIFIFFLFQTAAAQIVFCPPGAEWHYEFGVTFASATQNEQVSYVRDSTLGSETVKVLAHKKFYLGCNNSVNKLSLIKQKGDTVFFRNQATYHSWQILYNFAALPGQSWQSQVESFSTFPSYAATFTVVVDSVKIVTVNGFQLKKLYVHVPAMLSSFTITERLGAEYIFCYYDPDPSCDGDYFKAPLCYKDDAFGLKQLSNKPCNYIGYVGLEEGKKEDYPWSQSYNRIFAPELAAFRNAFRYKIIRSYRAGSENVAFEREFNRSGN